MASDFDDQSSGFELDVNQDGMITPNDALFVINRLNRKGSFVDLAEEWLHEAVNSNETDSEDGSSPITGEGEWMESLAINLMEQDRAKRKR